MDAAAVVVVGVDVDVDVGVDVDVDVDHASAWAMWKPTASDATPLPGDTWTTRPATATVSPARTTRTRR
jgi:hypothetical protein